MRESSKAIMFVQGLLDDEEDMAATINTESPKFLGSDEERCYSMHQQNIMEFQRVIRCLEKVDD